MKNLIINKHSIDSLAIELNLLPPSSFEKIKNDEVTEQIAKFNLHTGIRYGDIETLVSIFFKYMLIFM